ncbi:MAG: ceramidase domain-containing protein [Elusimicrobiota bacterium]|nr:ceramidase domain-containing protein [Elusimicrobiota bacterium]
MDPRVVPPLPDGCPWSGWALPDIKHCEANLCAAVTAPANSWSNLAYAAVGVWILTRPGPRGALTARGLGPVSLAIAATSFAFHASYTWAGQFLDYAGMFLLTGWCLARALLRLGLSTERGAAAAWAGCVVASLAALVALRALGWGVQWVMIVQAAAITAFELRLMTTRRDAPSYRPLFAMLALLVSGYALWHLDHSSLCRPDDHFFQLHAAWHLLTAAALVAAWRFHAGVDAARARA